MIFIHIYTCICVDTHAHTKPEIREKERKERRREGREKEGRKRKKARKGRRKRRNKDQMYRKYFNTIIEENFLNLERYLSKGIQNTM